MRCSLHVLLLGALIAGCGDRSQDLSGTRVGTQDNEVSVGPPVGRVVSTQRRAGVLRFPGDADSILSQDTLAQPDSLKPSAPTQAVVLTVLKLDSTQGIWLLLPGSSLPPKVLPVERVCLELVDTTGVGFELTLPGTGIAGTGVAGAEGKVAACFGAPSLRWTVALRRGTGKDREVRFVDSVQLGTMLEFDLSPLWRAKAGCRALLRDSGLVLDGNGAAVCMD